MAGKAPENILLSHDLFEGIFARSALATDIELFDEFPSHYEAAAARQYRWARGDWQLLKWIIGGRAGSMDGRKVKIPVIGRWKMLDNLRRSLLAPCLFLTLLTGWLMPGISPWLWTRFVLAMIAFPALIPFLAGINARLEGISKRSHFHGLASDFSLGLSQAGLTATFLAYQAWLMTDAIVRTLGRLLITHKHLLEWVTAAQAKHRVDLQSVWHFQADGQRGDAGDRDARGGLVPGSSCALRRRSFCDSLDGVARDRLLDQPSASAFRPRAAIGVRNAGTSRHFAAHVAILRDFCNHR